MGLGRWMQSFWRRKSKKGIMFRGKDEKLRVRHVELGGACAGHPCGNGHMTTGCLDHFLFTDIEAVLSGSTALLYLLCGHTSKGHTTWGGKYGCQLKIRLRSEGRKGLMQVLNVGEQSFLSSKASSLYCQAAFLGNAGRIKQVSYLIRRALSWCLQSQVHITS